MTGTLTWMYHKLGARYPAVFITLELQSAFLIGIGAVALIGFYYDADPDDVLIVMALTCVLSRRTGKVIEARTLDLGPGGMRITANRPLAPDELLEFELPERARIRGRARVLREQTYRVYALRFERLDDDARAGIADLAGPATPRVPAR